MDYWTLRPDGRLSHHNGISGSGQGYSIHLVESSGRSGWYGSKPELIITTSRRRKTVAGTGQLIQEGNGGVQ